MIGLATNLLVRYLTQDDLAQARKAGEVIEKASAKGEKLLIQPVVLCELVWVLETAYDYARKEVSVVMEKILRTAQFEFPEKEIVWRAWGDYRSGKGDFADYLIGRANEQMGVEYTITFDQALKSHKQFRVL